MNQGSSSKVAVIDCESTKTPNISQMVTDHRDSPEIINWNDANNYNSLPGDTLFTEDHCEGITPSDAMTVLNPVQFES